MGCIFSLLEYSAISGRRKKNAKIIVSHFLIPSNEQFLQNSTLHHPDSVHAISVHSHSQKSQKWGWSSVYFNNMRRGSRGENPAQNSDDPFLTTLSSTLKWVNTCSSCKLLYYLKYTLPKWDQNDIFCFHFNTISNYDPRKQLQAHDDCYYWWYSPYPRGWSQ